mmetsp:Transcript_38189/g.57579  ORF Transcript_38189/g.57579 Transcript_38189/m.57579 type:complete len:118 (-) Transcript_38189:211-564(-)
MSPFGEVDVEESTSPNQREEKLFLGASELARRGPVMYVGVERPELGVCRHSASNMKVREPNSPTIWRSLCTQYAVAKNKRCPPPALAQTHPTCRCVTPMHSFRLTGPATPGLLDDDY